VEARRDRAVLVIDNAVDADVVRRVVPATGSTRVIVTSTDQALAQLGVPVEVSVFDRAQSLAYLHARTRLDDEKGADQVAEELGDLPLALAQAASVIQLQRLDYLEYLARLRALPMADVLPRRSGDPYPKGAAESLLLSVQAVENTDESGVTGRLLEVMAVLSPTGADRTLVRELVHDRDGNPVGGARVDEAVARLVGLSLLVWGEFGTSVIMHRLVARIVREHRQAEGGVVATVLAVVDGLIPLQIAESMAWEHRKRGAELVAHTMALWEILLRHASDDPDAAEQVGRCAGMANWAVRHLTVTADLSRAAHLGTRVLADCERVLGAEHSTTRTVCERSKDDTTGQSRTWAKSMDIRTSGDTTHVPNDVIIALRKSRDWSRERLARQFEIIGRQEGIKTPDATAMAKQIYRLETGRTRQPTNVYEKLYCRTFDKSAAELFGAIEYTRSTTGALAIVRSHKFIPVFVGVDAASGLMEIFGPRAEQWTDCMAANHPHPEGTCDLYAWPFGVALFHLVENLKLECVSDLSVWRIESYARNLKWAGREAERLTSRSIGTAPHVLSAYWLDSHGWNSRDLCNALKLMCIPRVLLQRDCGDSARAQAVQVEKNLMRNGFDHPDLVDFGIAGSSIGYASWSGVVYHLIAPSRALGEHELIAAELSVQALWAYCEHIRRMVESGQDPVVPPEFGWRFLRGVRSRIINERPQETVQHRSMREAIIQTSGLDRHLAQTVEILKESDT
jgi:transcriptional regulator with XRE-family HTH domain